MRADGARADHELLPDLTCALPDRDESEHLTFPRRQLGGRVFGDGLRLFVAVRVLMAVCAWPERPAHTRDQLVGIERLDEVVVGTQHQPGDTVV